MTYFWNQTLKLLKRNLNINLNYLFMGKQILKLIFSSSHNDENLENNRATLILPFNVNSEISLFG